MKQPDKDETAETFERALADQATQPEYYVLRLYVSGSAPQSTQAIQNIQKICEDYLPGRHKLEVIDIYQQPHLAHHAQIIAAPTLIKQLPLPLRRLVGNMSDLQRVLVGLDLHLEKVESSEDVT